VNYEQLKSGKIFINDKTVRVSPLSSLKTAKIIAETLKKWIEKSVFFLSTTVEHLPVDTWFNSMKQTREISFINGIIQKAITCKEDEEIRLVAQRIIDHSVNHIVVIDNQDKLKGIVTSWDVTRAVAEGKLKLKDIITRRVVTTTPDESIDGAARKMAQNHISALPVIDNTRNVLGIITSEDVSKLIGR
jgi:CBS domain-containing protein